MRTLILACSALAVVFWIGLAYWVSRDARRRIRHRSLVGVATVLGLVPVLGPAIYRLFRPPETRDEIRARDAEFAVFEAQLRDSRPTCPECSAPVDADFLVCPVCALHLHSECAHCEAILDPLWQMCPRCAVPVEAELDLDEALTREIRSAPVVDVPSEPAIR
jgi:hypothetical protein